MNIDFFKEIEFDNDYIEKCLSKVDNTLKKYISDKILLQYDLNDIGHNKNHIEYVLKRALEISKDYSVDYNILYTCVCFHDIACYINREQHEILSADIAYKDEFLNNLFSNDEIIIIKEAIEDHRASSNNIPRNIYGTILSSADRNISIKDFLISSLFYKAIDINSLDINKAIGNSYNHAIDKFGKNGYAVNKFYVYDKKYKQFLNDLQYLIDNRDEFVKLSQTVFDEVKNK